MYIRVSSEAQNTARQEEAARQYKVDKVFIEKQSGKNTEKAWQIMCFRVRVHAMRKALRS